MAIVLSTVSLATAVIAIAISLFSLTHERGLSGVGKQVYIRHGRKSMPWSEVQMFNLPHGWDASELVFWASVRLVNIGPADMAILSPAKIWTLGGRREAVSVPVTLPSRKPLQTAIVVKGSKPCKYLNSGWVYMTWDAQGKAARGICRLYRKPVGNYVIDHENRTYEKIT